MTAIPASRAHGNRQAMPGVAAMVDEIRATCPGARVLWASENGVEVGRRPELEQDAFEVSAETLATLQYHEAARIARGQRRGG